MVDKKYPLNNLYYRLFLFLIELFLCMHVESETLSGYQFHSYGIHKEEEVTFLDDTLCVYKQTWDSGFFQGKLQHIDTFLYKIENEPEDIENCSAKKISIQKIGVLTTDVNKEYPISKQFYHTMDVVMPRTIFFADINSHLLFTGAPRRSTYHMFDTPLYNGEKTKLSDMYALVFDISRDTILMYDKQTICFASNHIKLFSQEIWTDHIQDFYSPTIRSKFFCLWGSYEYQRYCAVKRKILRPLLRKEDIKGSTFYYYRIDMFKKNSLQEESLHFLDDSCCIFQDQQQKTYCKYEIIDNLIVLKYLNNLQQYTTIADTLAYNNGFIFYAKIGSIHPADSAEVLEIKTFHKKKEGAVKGCANKWKIFDPKFEKLPYTYPEYQKFDSICYNTYIPINFP